MWTLGQIVDRSVSDGIDEPDAIQIANQRYAELVRRSGWLKADVPLTAVDSTNQSFALPSDVSRVLFLYFVTPEGLVRYPNRIGWGDMLAAYAGDVTAGGAFAEGFSGAAEAVVTVYPAGPSDDAHVFAEKTPTPLVNPTDELVIPDEFVQGLLDGIKAIVYRELDEDPGSSQAMEQSFENAVGSLKAFADARIVGDGPIAIPMRGVNWV